jgi:hypothetical protein
LRWANELSLDLGFAESDHTELFIPSAGLGRIRSIAGIGMLCRNLLILKLVRAHLYSSASLRRLTFNTVSVLSRARRRHLSACSLKYDWSIAPLA